MKRFATILLGITFVLATLALVPSAFGATTNSTAPVTSSIPGSFGKLLGAGIHFGLAAARRLELAWGRPEQRPSLPSSRSQR